MCAAITGGTDQQAGEDEERRSTLKLKYFQYPKPLASVTIMPSLDETNFTNQEKCALNNMWRYVKPNIRKHSIRIFKFFYKHNVTAIDLFRDEDGRINTNALYMHSHWVMRLYGTLIENALGSSSKFSALVGATLEAHKQHMIGREQILQYGESINMYLAHCLQKHVSASISTALEKFIQYVANMHSDTTTDSKEWDASKLSNSKSSNIS